MQEITGLIHAKLNQGWSSLGNRYPFSPAPDSRLSTPAPSEKGLPALAPYIFSLAQAPYKKARLRLPNTEGHNYKNEAKKKSVTSKERNN